MSYFFNHITIIISTFLPSCLPIFIIFLLLLSLLNFDGSLILEWLIYISFNFDYFFSLFLSFSSFSPSFSFFPSSFSSPSISLFPYSFTLFSSSCSFSSLSLIFATSAALLFSIRLLGARVGQRVYWPGSGLDIVEYDLLEVRTCMMIFCHSYDVHGSNATFIMTWHDMTWHDILLFTENYL